MFEVIKREGAARTGMFSAGETILKTPCAADVEGIFESLGDFPISNVPLYAGRDFTERYLAGYGDVFASHPFTEDKASPGSLVMISNWHTALSDPRNYAGWISSMKERQPADTAWYAPACALPSNVATLVSSGFDIFDYIAVDLASARGIFCTPDGEYPAGECMESGMCRCTGCMEGDLCLHNRNALDSEIAKVRSRIERGDIREYVEKQSMNAPPLVSILRLFDRDYDFIEKATPIARSIRLYANSGDSINRPEVRRFSERVVSRYIPPKTDVAVLLPCSARKPYSSSQSHRKFSAVVRNRAHEIIVTSPLALVPRELEEIYPAGHYDVPVTGYWDMEERKIIGGFTERYFSKNKYGHVYVHLDGDAAIIACEALERSGTPFTVTTCGSPTSPESLKTLDSELSGLRGRGVSPIGGVLSWQFGVAVDTPGMIIKGRFNNRKVLKGGKQLFSIDNSTGFYRPTFDGWMSLGDVYTVGIDDFIPKGDILAPGVVSCDSAIRPGDEVFVRGSQAVATGRAVMGASEMMNSSRGIAVRVRKVKKN